MHRSDDRSRWRFLLVQLPAFMASLLCLGTAMHCLDPESGFRAVRHGERSGYGDAATGITLCVVCFFFGLEFWRLDRPRK